jgi:hypothetical protein
MITPKTFNFYVGGVLVSTAFQDFERPQLDTSSFTYYFDLDPLDFEQDEGDIHYAYIELLKNIKKNGSQLGIEAALPSKNLNHKSYVPIAYGSFYLRFDDVKYREWKELATDYNIQLKKLADSTMKNIFGEIGFSKNFTMSCLQNPCAKGYLYTNTLVSNNPCTSQPQDSCKEAIITYNYIKKGVPLAIKMLVAMKENGDYIYLENNQYGKKKITMEQQNILSIAEIKAKIKKQFPKDSLSIFTGNNALSFSHTPIQQPDSKVKGKMDRDPGYRLIKETTAGKNWKGGFTYIASKHDPKKLQKIYHFDAVTGKLLCITEIYKVTNESSSKQRK